MRRMAVMFASLVVLAGGLSVTLVSVSSGRTRPAAHAQSVAKAPALARLVPQAKLPPLARLLPQVALQPSVLLAPPAKLRALPRHRSLTITKGYRPLLPVYGTCYVGVQQCSIHPCTVYVAPRAAPAVSSAVDQIFAPEVAGPPRSTRCVSTPVQKTVPVGAPVITAAPAKTKTVLSESYVEPAVGR